MVKQATDEELEARGYDPEKVAAVGEGRDPATAATGGEEDGGLSDATPEGTEITFRGRKFVVTEMLVGQLLTVSADVAEFGIAFHGINRDDMAMILAIVTSKLDIVSRIAATVLSVDVAFIEGAKATDLLTFCRAFYAENTDFFRQLWELLPDTYKNRTGETGAGAQPAEAEGTRSESDPTNEAGMIGST